jgi:uncharacterized protein (TIGR03435 family)
MKARMLRPIFAFVCAWLPSPHVAAQQERETFQFVSVRIVPGECPVSGDRKDWCIGSSGLVPSRAPSSISIQPGGRFEARNQTFENLARIAFGFEGVDPRRGVVERPRVFVPANDRFDITAVTDREWTRPPAGESVPAELRPMLRALLEERFQMKARVETKRVDVYALRLSKNTREPGPGLRRSTATCRGPYTDQTPNAPDSPECPFLLEFARVQAGAVTMTEVARIISRIQGFSDRAIVDDTGLDGIYDLTLTIPSAPVLDRRPIAVREAMQEQLNLELHKAKLPIPTLIIERVKKPTED